MKAARKASSARSTRPPPSPRLQRSRYGEYKIDLECGCMGRPRARMARRSHSCARPWMSAAFLCMIYRSCFS